MFSGLSSFFVAPIALKQKTRSQDVHQLPECNDKPVPITTYLNRGVLAPDLLSATAKPQPQESASSSLAFCTVPFICLELDGGVSILLAAVKFQQFCRAGPSPSKQPPERSLKGVL